MRSINEIQLDPKRRIQDEFFVISEEENKIVPGGRKCPFAGVVLDRPSICARSASLSGMIAAGDPGRELFRAPQLEDLDAVPVT